MSDVVSRVKPLHISFTEGSLAKEMHTMKPRFKDLRHKAHVCTEECKREDDHRQMKYQMNHCN